MFFTFHSILKKKSASQNLFPLQKINKRSAKCSSLHSTIYQLGKHNFGKFENGKLHSEVSIRLKLEVCINAKYTGGNAKIQVLKFCDKMLKLCDKKYADKMLKLCDKMHKLWRNGFCVKSLHQLLSEATRCQDHVTAITSVALFLQKLYSFTV